MDSVATFTVFTRAAGEIQFNSDLKDQDVYDILATQTSQFARDLVSRWGRLSDKQYAWAHKIALDSYKKNSEEKEPVSEQFDRLFAAFDSARARGAKRMKMRFNGIALSPSRDGAALWVTSLSEKEEGNYGLQPKYLGKVTRSGCDSRISDDVKSIIMAAATDPLTAAIRYGKDTGECSCCGRELTNSESIRLGIGPICREKFGL